MILSSRRCSLFSQVMRSYLSLNLPAFAPVINFNKYWAWGHADSQECSQTYCNSENHVFRSTEMGKNSFVFLTDFSMTAWLAGFFWEAAKIVLCEEAVACLSMICKTSKAWHSHSSECDDDFCCLSFTLSNWPLCIFNFSMWLCFLGTVMFSVFPQIFMQVLRINFVTYSFWSWELVNTNIWKHRSFHFQAPVSLG